MSSSPISSYNGGLHESSSFSELDQLCINTVRVLSADMVQKAKSGHPGAPMGCAPLAHVLFSRFMRFSPTHPRWIKRDRFVLSNGHACALQYSLLHLLGYDLSMDELKNFRKVGSLTPGHPEANHTPGIEVSSGPLGQGIACAVGMAVTEAHLAATFNRPGFPMIDNYTYVLCGDGCLMEGISAEAASLAGHLGLGKLILFYDQNHVSIDGSTDLAFTENVAQRFEGYHWHVQTIEDGDHDLSAMAHAIIKARQVHDRPSIILVKTTIGYGSAVQGTEKAHGSPLGDAALADAKKFFGFDPDQFFHIPDKVHEFYGAYQKHGLSLEMAYRDLLTRYEKAYPSLAEQFKRRLLEEKLPDNWIACLPTFPSSTPAKATRQSSREVLNVLAKHLPELVGGSADLTPSTLTDFEGSHDFQKGTPDGRYFRFGVREHAMAGMMNGMASYGGVIPFCSTFLNFITYAWGAVRLSALSKFRVIYIMTHDSIGLGEDGPTHQPIEVATLCRSTPNLLFIRPADGNEVSAAYRLAIEHISGPTVIALTRQNLPALRGSSIEKTLRGGYVIYDPFENETNNKDRSSLTTARRKPDVILVSTGSEVSLCIEAAELLAREQPTAIHVSVVSLPCWSIFDRQPLEYRLQVLPDHVPILSVEAYSVIGWARYAHASIGVDTFGSSGPYKDVYKKLHLTPSDLIDRVKKLIVFYKESSSSTMTTTTSTSFPYQPRSPMLGPDCQGIFTG
jgi:transketolase